MLNLAQRLILGCVLLIGLTVGLVALTHRSLADTPRWPMFLRWLRW